MNSLKSMHKAQFSIYFLILFEFSENFKLISEFDDEKNGFVKALSLFFGSNFV